MDGIARASKEYITQFHGDNEASPEFLTDFIKSRDKADIISAYSVNSSSRSVSRRAISDMFVTIMNIIFGLHWQYYNGAFLCRTNLLRHMRLVSKGFAVYAEAKVRLVKKGYTLLEIPSVQIGRRSGKSKAVNIGSIVHTMHTLISLIWDSYVTGNL